MAKTLKEILAGSKASKKEKLKLGEKPGVDYAPKAKEEQEFVAKHEIEKFSDRVGNGDEAYKATTVKHAQTEEDPHGHKSRKDEKVNEEAAKDEYVKLPSGLYRHTPTGKVFTSPPKLPHQKETSKYEKDPSGYKRNMHTNRLESEDSFADGNYLAEGTVVSRKVVMNQRGGEDHYEMHHHGTGSTGWHSIIKTHQDGRSLMNDHGGYNALHVGSEKYVAQKWKGITHQKLLPADHPMRQNWRETPDATPMPKLKAVKEESLDEKEGGARYAEDAASAGYGSRRVRGETVLVTDKADKKSTKTGGGVKRIKKSEYDEKKHSLAENKVALKDYLRAIANRAMHAVFETENKKMVDDSLVETVEAIKASLDLVNDSIVESKVK